MLTREAFQTLYEQGPEALWQAFHALQAQVNALALRQKELEDRLNKDSHNSSLPPASDGFKKKNKPVNLRQSSPRKPGAQKGNPGQNLAFSDSPDHTLVHSPTSCTGCGASLEGVCATGRERRQVHDLPPLFVEITEHQSEQKGCPACGLQNRGAFPQEVVASVQYGPRLKALSIYLLDYQLLPYKRIATFFADVFGTRLSSGMLFEAQQRASTRLQPVIEKIRQALLQADVVHFDETGFRVQTSLCWLHSASTASLTAYAWHKKRGKVGMDAAGILPSFFGRAVHDGYASYQAYPCSHALCNAHHLRELTALYEQGGAEWAKDLRHLLSEIKHAVDLAKAQGKCRLSALSVRRFERHYQKLLTLGLAANPASEPLAGKRGRTKQSPARNLLERLQRNQSQVLAFLYDFGVPFDNNQAERDIRMMKLHQKISGCFRSDSGAEAFCHIRSYLCTLQKQGHNLLSALEHVFRGTPLYPAFA